MKTKIFTIVALFCAVIFSSCSSRKSIKLGIVTINEDGQSIGSVTEMTALKELINEGVEIVDIWWTWHSFKYPNNDIQMRLTYDGSAELLKVTQYIDSGYSNFSREEYNNLSEEELLDFLAADEKAFVYINKYSPDTECVYSNN